MKKIKVKLASAVAALMMLAGVSPAAHALDELTVAYFLEWPMPFQYGKVTGAYEKALGAKINWVSFDTGTAMSAAMASGDVQIAVSQGLPPFVVATSAGQGIQIVDVAVSYSENDNCVVASRLEIDKNNAKELNGKKVGIPKGTAAHFGFLRQMKHFGVNVASMEVVDMAPAEGAAAFSQNNLDMVCGWGGALKRMKEHGNTLLTGAEKEKLGILVFDVTSVPTSFAAENGDVISKFLKITADMNEMWNSGKKKHRAKMLPVIAKDAGMSEASAADSLKTFSFPGVREQLSDKWLGGGIQKFMVGVAKVFKDAKSIEKTLSTYDNAVDASYLKDAESM